MTDVTLPREVVERITQKLADVEAWLYRNGPAFYHASIQESRVALATEQPYDQTALELCHACGWKTLIPSDVAARDFKTKPRALLCARCGITPEISGAQHPID